MKGNIGRRIAVCYSLFDLAGSKPGQLKELVEVERQNGQIVRPFYEAHLDKGTSEASPKDDLDFLADWIGQADVVVINARHWRRALRALFAEIPNHPAKRILSKAKDVNQALKQHFPRQRKDLAALAKKLTIQMPDEWTGLARDAVLLGAIAEVLSPHVEVLKPDQQLFNPMQARPKSHVQQSLFNRLANWFKDQRRSEPPRR